MYKETEFLWLTYIHFAIVLLPVLGAPFVFLYEKQNRKKIDRSQTSTELGTKQKRAA